MIYADNAATTRLSEAALEGMLPYLREGFGNPSSLHGMGRAARRAVREARVAIAKAIGADADEIFFTSGGTESDNWAVKSVVEAKGGDGLNIVTSAIEHHAVLNACEAVARKGCEIRFLPVDSEGFIRLSQLPELMNQKTVLVSVMMANNEIGTIQDIQKIVKAAHAKGVLVHTDAVQAVGHIRFNVHDLGVDLLSASAHKFNGPKGIGFLYVKKGVVLPPLLNGGGQELGLRAGTENVAAIVGMSIALKEHLRQIARRSADVAELADLLRDGLRKLNPRIRFNGHENPAWRHPGIVSITIPGQSGEGLLHILDLKGIAVSTGAACNSRETVSSHVLKAIGLSDNLARSTIRISFGHENTEADVMGIVEALSKVV